MKNRKRELLICLIIIGAAVLFRFSLILLNDWFGGPPTVNTTDLPVQSGHVTITMSSRAYHAKAVVVIVGTVVTWVNQDPMAHTVTEGQDGTALSHGFNSGVIAPGASWNYTFKTPGTYWYTCTFHPDMNGLVVVKLDHSGEFYANDPFRNAGLTITSGLTTLLSITETNRRVHEIVPPSAWQSPY